MGDIQTKIKGQIDWFYKNGSTQNIEKLLELQEKLSANLYYYADTYREQLLDYAEKYGSYKTMFAKTYLENIAKKIQETMTSKQAEELAKDKTMTEWSAQMFSSAHIDSMKVEIRAIEKILSALQQRISHLKSERSVNNFKT